MNRDGNVLCFGLKILLFLETLVQKFKQYLSDEMWYLAWFEYAEINGGVYLACFVLEISFKV